MSSSGQGPVPNRHEIYRAVSSFPVKQKALLFALSLVFLAGLVGVGWKLNDRLLVNVAVPGGTLSEGIVGIPSHANPLLAVTDADRDIVSLVYSGLLKPDGKGKLAPDLAESYSVSEDGLSYTFKLKDHLSWQDGTPLTADDVEFTILKAQDPAVKSPRRAAWEGVRIEKPGPGEIRFVLKKPYASFLENATLGILPKHLWKDVKPDAFLLSERNQNGIGSGPYRVASIVRDPSGLPSEYDLVPFAGYALGEPKISQMKLRFYDNENELRSAYEKGEVESWGSVPPETAEALAKRGTAIRKISLPRSFAVFFGSGNPALSDPSVRVALDLATDRNEVIGQALRGYAIPVAHPIPPGSIGYLDGDQAPGRNLVAARAMLERHGWKQGDDGVYQKTDKKKTVRLSFTLATSNAPELRAAAETLSAGWKALGADVQVSAYEPSDLDQNLIRPRKFEALLFGEVIGRDPDLYSFWHSSQRLAPGLNITQYANQVTDKLLETARRAPDPDAQAAAYAKFQDELDKDTPAIFLYSPYYLYAMPAKVKGLEFPSLTVAADRFATIERWYVSQERVWKIFAGKI